MEDFRQKQKPRVTPAETPVDLTVPSFHLAPGQIIGDRYEVKSVIGQGGMGCVYLVEQLFLHKVFALKTLNPGHMSDLAWRRFQKEAQATSAFDHPNLIKVYDFGMIDDSQPFFVMDYFDGDTLAYHIEQKGALPLSDVLSIFSQVCFALAHAHKQGVIHRDIKPSNIMIAKVNDDYQIKVVDFGIAKLINASDHETLALTRTGEVFGTPYYMSPEQCLGTAIDHRADIYSLGCVLFQSLTGMPPFIGDTALSIMMQHQTSDPVSLQEASLGKTFPEAADRVIRKMLQKKPEDRYQSLLEVAGDLELIKLGQRIISQKHATLSKKSEQPLKLVLGVAAVVILLTLAFAIGRSSAPTKEPSTVTSTSKQAPSLIDQTYQSAATKVASSGTGFYSVIGDPKNPANTRMRIFHFGEQSLPGVMQLPASVDCLTAEVMRDGEKKVFARGDVVINNFKPFVLLVSADAADEPEMIKRFRSDEIEGLTMNSIDSFVYRDSLLAECTHLKSINSVKIDGGKNITDQSIKYLDQLPNLVELVLNKTAVTGAAVGKLHNIKKLQVLDLGSLVNESGAGVLPSLAGSKAIRELNLRRNRVDDQHGDWIASLPNLESLNVSGSGISDETLRKFQHLKHLRELNIFGCDKLTPSSFAILAKFPALKLLTIGSTAEQHNYGNSLPELVKLMGSRCTVRFDL